MWELKRLKVLVEKSRTFFDKVVYIKIVVLYNRYILNKRKEKTMKIQVKYQPKTSKVLVYHIKGKKSIEDMLGKINLRIKSINDDLRGLYE